MNDPSKHSPLRAFIALPIPTALRDALARAQDELRYSRTAAKWVAPENFHVTLFFLGELAAGQLDAIGARLEGVSRRHSPFPVTLHGLGAFPNARKLRTVWAGFAGDLTSLKALAVDVADAMADLGFEREGPFKPHLTLARTRPVADLGELSRTLQGVADLPFGSFTAEEIVLYQSELRPRGPVYTPLARYPLSSSGPSSP